MANKSFTESAESTAKSFFSDLTPERLKPSSEEIERSRCISAGGQWDSANKKCVFPAKKETPAPVTAPKVKPTTPEIFKDEETGAITGVKLPTGDIFMGKPGEIRDITTNFQADTTLPAGTRPAGTTQAGVDRAVRLQQLMQMGEQGLLSPQELQAIQQTPIDFGQALTAGAFNAIPSAIGFGAAGAGIGAAAGLLGGPAAPITVPAGAIIGGIAGIVKGLYSGVQVNIKSQQSGEIARTKDILAAARVNMRALSLVASKDPTKAEGAITLYYQQLAQVQRAHRQLQVEVQGNLNKYMEDGTEDLSDFELFLQPGGYADIQLIKLQQATLKGTPASDAELLEFFQEEFLDE